MSFSAEQDKLQTANATHFMLQAHARMRQSQGASLDEIRTEALKVAVHA